MAHDKDADRRFLEEGVARGELTEMQAADCRRILDTLAEVEVALTAADVAVRKGHLTKDVADQIKRALARRRVGRYEVIDRLGRGGSGVVWRARDTRLGRIVALKLLARPRAPDDVLTSYHSRFQREARTAVTLNHVNIVRGLDYGEEDGYVFFAMEFVSGESAADRLRREGRIAESEALQIGLQVVEALEYVSQFGLVHRDLKPENLLLTAAGEVKVCDLGLAKPTLEEASRMGGAGTIAGTPLYMAPEQIEDPDSVDWRTDVYGLGATLYHMLTGRPPFRSGGGKSVIERHLHEAVADPREHVLELSAGASAVVLKMLTKDPDRRYASLSDLGADLAAAVDGRPPSCALSLTSSSDGAVAEVLVEAQGARARMGRGRGRVRRALAASLIAAALGVTAWDLWGREEPPTEVTTVEPAPAEKGAEPRPESPEVVDPIPTKPVADPGRGALDVARQLERDQASLDAVIEQYEFVVEKFAAHPSGARATERLAELQVVLQSHANQELIDRRKAAEGLLRSGNYAAAIKELMAFPLRYEDTPAYTEALADAERFTREGRERGHQLLAEAVVAAFEGRVADGRAALEAAKRVGLPELASAIVEAERDVDLEEAKFDRLRREQTAEYLVQAGRALMASQSDDAAATRIVDAAQSRLRTYRTEFDALREWLPLARRARVRLDSTWQLWAEESKELRFRSVGYPVRDLAGRAASLRDGKLTVTSGDGFAVVRPEELPTALLVEAISPGASENESHLDEVAAFLLSTRRLADAEAFSAPPNLVDAVRAAAVAEVEVQLVRIEQLVDRGEVVAARDAVSRVIAYAPWCAAPWTALGALRAELSDRDGAIEAFEVAIYADRPDPAAHFGIAAIYEARRDYRKAEEHLLAFLEMTRVSDDEELAALRPTVEAMLERVSARRLERTVAALRSSAKKALRQGRTTDARRDLEQILALVSDDPAALFELAELYYDKGQVFPAWRAYRRLMETRPDYKRKLVEKRVIDLERHRGTSSPAGREAAEKGREALMADDHDAAISKFRTAIQLMPFLLEAHVGLARAYEARGLATVVREDIRAAVSAASDALLIDPEYAPALLVRARARLELSELEAALVDANDACESRDARSRSAAHILAGRAYLGMDAPRKALARFDKAFEVHAHEDPVYWQAVAYERRGDRAAARHRLDFLYDQWGAPPHLQDRIERLDQILDD